MTDRYCIHCGTVAKPRRLARGTFAAEVVLWLLAGAALLVFWPLALLLAAVGLGYSLWRLLAPRRLVCRTCRAEGVIPLDSPAARRALEPPAEPAPPQPPPQNTEVVHEVAARTGGTYRLLARHQLPPADAKALIARALTAGRVHEPGRGQVVTVRVR